MPVPPRFRRLIAWFDNPDPRLAAAGTTALVVAGLLLLYPFAVWFVAGSAARPALLTWISVPFLVATAPVCRRRPDLGRGLLAAAAIGSTILAVFALGVASRAELVHLPWIALLFLVYAPAERRRPLGIGILAMIAGAVLVRLSGIGLAAPGPAAIYGLAKLHAFGTLLLLGAFALIARRLR